MQVQIVLAPDLALNVDDVIAAWNSTPQTQALARAARGDSAAVAFPLTPEMQHALIFLAGVAGTITVDVIKDVVKTQITDFLARQRKAQPKAVKVDTVPQPDGAVLLVVHEE